MIQIRRSTVLADARASSETVVGLVESCSPTGRLVFDRRRSQWEIWSCSGGVFRAQRGPFERSPDFRSELEARTWASDRGMLDLGPGETGTILKAAGVVFLVLVAAALLFGKPVP